MRVISRLENGRQAMADSLLVLVPHKTLQGTISIMTRDGAWKSATHLRAGKGVFHGAPLVQGEEGMMALQGYGVQHHPDVYRLLRSCFIL